MNLDKLIPQKINFNKSISNHQILLNANILDRNILVIGGASYSIPKRFKALPFQLHQGTKN